LAKRHSRNKQGWKKWIRDSAGGAFHQKLYL